MVYFLKTRQAAEAKLRELSQVYAGTCYRVRITRPLFPGDDYMVTVS